MSRNRIFGALAVLASLVGSCDSGEDSSEVEEPRGQSAELDAKLDELARLKAMLVRKQGAAAQQFHDRRAQLDRLQARTEKVVNEIEVTKVELGELEEILEESRSPFSAFVHSDITLGSLDRQFTRLQKDLKELEAENAALRIELRVLGN